MSDRLLQLQRELIEAFNRRDWQGMRKLYAPQVRWGALPTGAGTTVEGVDALVDFFETFVRDSIPDLKFTFQRGVASDDTSVVEVLWEGTQTGPIEASFGSFPASGKPFRIYATYWTRWEDKQVVDVRAYIDNLGMMIQVGALAMPSDA